MSIIHHWKKCFPLLKRHFQKIKVPQCSYASVSPLINYKANSKILDYHVKKVDNIPELNLVAVLLQSSTSGAEHLHLACEDSNNLFSVAFRTPPSDSTGVVHILEHLALCGSQRFPCRDPFFNMLNRSLSTFMNAFTGSDQTIYAFSTQNEKDFENLLSVYLDAAFYPSLHEKDFRQEGWRLEHENINDKNSPIIFKGVVFNEMKGVFSDPNQFYARHLQNCLFPSNSYRHESGGDPLAIPQLTWEGLRAFHARHYHPSNSRFLTYGNMPLETHLERIQNHVLSRFGGAAGVDSEVPDVERWSEPREAVIYYRLDPMAAVPEKQIIVSQSYVLSRITDTRENFALSILGSLLVDGPNSPFYQKLLESGLGPDYSPCTGFDSNLRESVFSVGVREVGEKDVEVAKRLISETFDQVIQNGFPEEQVKSILHRIELATKHRTANFGLNCVMGVSSMWNHNGDPVAAFKVNDHVRWIQTQLEANPRFFQDKGEQYFKNNKHQLTLIMKPVENFESELKEKENKLLKTMLSKLSEEEKQQLYNEGLELSDHQKHNDVSCLPSLQLEDVSRNVDKTPLRFSKIGSVPVQLCEQPTNEVVYFRALLDASDVSEEDIPLLPLFADVITQMGAGHRDYKQFDQDVQLTTAGLNVSPHVPTHPSNLHSYDQNILLSSYCLKRNIGEMFSLWTELFNRVRLDDSSRFSQLVRMRAAELAQSITHHGHALAMSRAASALSPAYQKKEGMSGLTQIAYMKQLAEMSDHEVVLEKVKKLANALFHRVPLRCSINSTPELMPSAIGGLETFLKSLEVHPVPPNSPESNFKPKTEKTHFVLPFAVNYLGRSLVTVPYSHQDFASLKIAAKLMSSKFLHSEIREKGGAYGGGASVNKSGLFMFYSYRDPNVSRTLDSFSSGVEWLASGSYSDQDIVEAKLGVFSAVDSPVTPGARGSLFFLEGVSDEMREQMRLGVFQCSRQDLKDVADRYLRNPAAVGTALIGPPRTEEDSSEWTVIDNKL